MGHELSDTLPFPGELDDLSAWTELSYAMRLTDGLPVAPPLAETVAALVAGSGRHADEFVALIPPRDGRATIEVIAANAAMACRGTCPPSSPPWKRWPSQRTTCAAWP